MVELSISKLTSICLAFISDFFQLFLAIGHIVNRHVWISIHTSHHRLSLRTHLGQSSHTLLMLFLFFLLSQIFSDLLLAFFINEFNFEGIEKSLLVGSHLSDLS